MEINILPWKRVKKLIIVNAYWVCKNDIKTSDISTNYNQWCELLVGQEDFCIDPRKEIITDIVSLKIEGKVKE